MKNILFTLIMAGLLGVSSLTAGILTQLNSHNDHGIWFIQRAKVKLSDDWSINFKMEQRLGANYKKFWNYQYEGVFQYNLLNSFSPCFVQLTALSIGPGYNSTTELKKNTNSNYHWVRINRSILEANVAFSLGDWEIKQRLRGEYYDYTKKHYKDFGLYRHRLAIYAPWKFTCYKIQPFSSNEWFLRNNTYSSSHTTGLVGTYYENRFRIGFTSNLAECLDSSLCWQWRATKQRPGTHPGWFYTYQYCVSIDLKF